MSRDAVILVGLVLALTAIGLVMLYSATAVTAERSERYHDDTHFLGRQLVWALISVAALFAVSRVPYTAWARWRWPILGFTVVLLALVFVPGIGAKINAARRWIKVAGLFVQPSETAKIGLAVALCAWAAADPARLIKFRAGLLPAVGMIGLVCGMVLIGPDVGTALFIGFVMTLTLVVAGVRWKHVISVGTVATILVSFLVMTHFEHVEKRLEGWLHPERDPQGTGLQIIQSKIALGSGNWFGVGLGKGTSKLSFLPEVHSDFIFPVIGEELGFVGAAGVLLLYAALGFVGFRIMRRAPDRFGFLLSFAVVAYIILQAAFNVAVVTALVPTKGIPLPFVSAGGSSLLFTMVGVGMLMSVANASERGTCLEGDRDSCSPAEEPAATSSRG